jgi:hypothetical protein
MNPNSETDRSRLKRSYEWSKDQMQPFRDTRRRLIKDYVGPQYGAHDSKEMVQFLSLIYQAATTYQFTLAANRPRVLVNTDYTSLLPFARRFQINLNNLIAEIRLEETLQQIVLEAFFKIGIGKVCMADSVAVQLEPNLWADPGRPFAKCVSLDRYCHDMTAEALPEAAWAMDFYDVDYEKLQDKNLFDQNVVALLKADRHADARGRDGQEVVAELSQGGGTTDVTLYEQKEIVDVWLPRDKLIATFDSTFSHKPLAVRDVEDQPETGPYHYLTFDDVPDNTIGTAPGEHLKEIADLINSLTRKLARQARGQKTIYAYEGDAEEDAKQIKRSSDQELRKVNRIDGVGAIKFGGIDPGNQAFAMQLTDIFDRMAGNLQAMAGLGPQAETLGQENLIQSTVSKKAAKMQYRVAKFTAGIASDLGWLMWSDKVMQREAYEEVEGFPDIRVPAGWRPDFRQGDFSQYKFDIEPFSMMYQSPGERAQKLIHAVTQLAIPISQTPFGQASGMNINIEKLFDDLAALENLPQLRHIIQFEGTLPDNLLPSADDGPKQAAATTRTNVRKNVSSGVGQQGQRHAAMDQLMSQARQQTNGSPVAMAG